ncbi:hypothetical protein ACUXAV_001812 [Cupriavidus metallidurans]|jgi:hypothetical protein|uniref:hypothetical protein n=1 Tax=Cupriavidus TaxID=106589 RepID=UPI000AB61756|nr:hypothetical protein [Cupriavidus metallidurans]MDE4917193.1 hypothetical protein [Cupriavidus metallidurans]
MQISMAVTMQCCSSCARPVAFGPARRCFSGMSVDAREMLHFAADIAGAAMGEAAYRSAIIWG